MMAIKWLVAIVTLLCAAHFNDGQNLLSKPDPQLEWQIPLTKCCASENEFYSLGFDTCTLNGEMNFNWPPPVYSARTNESVSAASARFSLTFNLSTCTSGYASQSTRDFRLYTDGSAVISSSGERLPANSFCLNQISSGEVDAAEFAVRHCASDPCNQTNCIRKCCPLGMALNTTTQLCQTYNEPFALEFRNVTGHVVTPNPASYLIRQGDAPKCQHGMFPLSPNTNPEDEFYVLPDGQIYLPYYPENDRYTRDYCIDDFSSEEGIYRQALLCFPPQPEESADNQLVLKVFPYFLFLSSLFLIATFIVYAMIPEIRNIHGVTIMCHVASLAVMYIGLCVIQLGPQLPDGVCVGLAVIVHFTFLSTFTWLNVMSFDIWWTFSDLRPRNSRHGRQHLGRRIIFYSIYAWGVPFIIVLVGQVLDHLKNLPQHIVTPGFGEVKCWFFEKEAFLVYLYGPIAVLILSNIVFFVMTAVLLYRASVDAAFAVNSAHAKQKFRVIFSLFILMGVSWMMEVISFAVGGSAYIWIPTDILNILTGVFIFVIFVCKPNVWKLLKLKCPCLKRLDGCCPSYMTRSNTRQGTTTRSTIKEVSHTKSLNNLGGGGGGGGGHQLDSDSKKKIRMDAPTQSTQLRDSTQVDSGDEMMIDHESIRMA